MKFLSLVLILSFGVCIPKSLAGLAISPEQKPIKFLVLQRSDVMGDDPDVTSDETTAQPEDEQPDQDAPVTESVDEDKFTSDPSVNDEPAYEASNQNVWNPADGWRELNFTIIPEGEGDFQIETKTRQSEVEKKSGGEVSDTSIRTIQGVQRIPCRCGNATSRIVNGVPARINDIPWTAALVRNGFFGFGASKKPYCGATLINNHYVVTASHCVDGMFANGIKVWLNEEDYLISSESTRQEYLVDEIIMNKDYDRRNVNNDIALLKLAKAVPIGTSESFVTPICLPANNDADFAGLTGTVAGWGLEKDGGTQSHVLRKVEVPIITNDKCNSDETKYKGKISPNMLCAGYLEGGKDSCQGDSGGPLFIENGGRKTLVGIVSWGFGCAQPESPGVYTRVGVYPGWILEHTKDALWCDG